MRLNKFIAQGTGISRRAADSAINSGRVQVNGQKPSLGQDISSTDSVTLDGRAITPDVKSLTIMLHKPAGYVCSREGQGSQTIYDLLPKGLHHLKPVGRLDKNSSGLLLLTNDGNLANKLTHPRYQKTKVYEIKLDRELAPADLEKVTKQGIELGDGPSKFQMEPLKNQNIEWKVTMHEGRNRQIRRTFDVLGYEVARLHRIELGPYQLDGLPEGLTVEV